MSGTAPLEIVFDNVNWLRCAKTGVDAGVAFVDGNPLSRSSGYLSGTIASSYKSRARKLAVRVTWQMAEGGGEIDLTAHSE